MIKKLAFGKFLFASTPFIKMHKKEKLSCMIRHKICSFRKHILYVNVCGWCNLGIPESAAAPQFWQLLYKKSIAICWFKNLKCISVSFWISKLWISNVVQNLLLCLSCWNVHRKCSPQWFENQTKKSHFHLVRMCMLSFKQYRVTYFEIQLSMILF